MRIFFLAALLAGATACDVEPHITINYTFTGSTATEITSVVTKITPQGDGFANAPAVQNISPNIVETVATADDVSVLTITQSNVSFTGAGPFTQSLNLLQPAAISIPLSLVVTAKKADNSTWGTGAPTGGNIIFGANAPINITLVDGSLCGSATCTAPTSCCSNVCTDITSDTGHCGACGVTCPTSATCTNSACKCPVLKPRTCGSECVALDDPNNCGSSCTKCATGDLCTAGKCVKATGPMDMSSSTDMPATDLGGVCSGGKIFCGICVDPTKPANCGTCLNNCMAMPATPYCCTPDGGSATQSSSCQAMPINGLNCTKTN